MLQSIKGPKRAPGSFAYLYKPSVRASTLHKIKQAVLQLEHTFTTRKLRPFSASSSALSVGDRRRHRR